MTPITPRLLLAAAFLGLLAGCESPTLPVITPPSTPRAATAIVQTSRADLPESSQLAAAPPKETETPPPAEKDGPPVRKPPTNRAPRRPGEPIPASFDILILGMQADMVFRDFMLSDEVRELDGQKIELTGYMNPFTENRAKESKFILLRNTECKFGRGGQADHLAEILLSEGVRTAYSVKPVTVVGTLRIVPKRGEDGNTWSIYTIENAVIK